MKKILPVMSILFLAVLIFAISTRRKPVDFTSQVKPIINKKCITCHGGVGRKADSVSCSAMKRLPKSNPENMPSFREILNTVK